MRDENLLEKSHVVYLSGKPMMPYLFRYQRLAVDDGGLSRFVYKASPLMPQSWGITAKGGQASTSA